MEKPSFRWAKNPSDVGGSTRASQSSDPSDRASGCPVRVSGRPERHSSNGRGAVGVRDQQLAIHRGPGRQPQGSRGLEMMRIEYGKIRAGNKT